MKKFNIRKVLDGLTAASSSSSSSATAQPGTPRENDVVQETLQSEHFQLCKTVRHGFPYQPSSMAFDPVQKILAVGTQTGALRLYPFLFSCGNKIDYSRKMCSPPNVHVKNQTQH
ncbi:Syntaxin-binding protein 5 [Goodea atripinnis]|uniref:Syntaxin-binding protein 5 n=1 Tax=Goodea atripinnis TaxID=208336 RepID=A0ABV0PJI7_9TELE